MISAWGTAQAQPAMVAPCGLMSQAVAAGINGGPVGAGQEQDLATEAKQCVFSGDGNAGQVTVGELGQQYPQMTVAQEFELGETNGAGPGTTITPVSGLGDEAYFQSENNGTTFDVWVLRGQVMLDVDTTPVPAQAGNAGLEAVMVAAARTALKGM
jgi:hypothetical protein